MPPKRSKQQKSTTQSTSISKVSQPTPSSVVQKIENCFVILEPFFNKVQNQQPYTMIEGSAFYSAVYDLLLDFDENNEQIDIKTILSTLRKRIDEIYYQYIIECKSLTAEQAVGYLSQRFEFSTKIKPEILKVFSHLKDYTSGTHETVEHTLNDALVAFMDSVMTKADLQNKLISLWEYARQGGNVDISSAKTVLSFYATNMNDAATLDKIFKRHLKALIGSSRAFYTSQLSLQLSYGIPTFLKYFHVLKREEQSRAERALYVSDDVVKIADLFNEVISTAKPAVLAAFPDMITAPEVPLEDLKAVTNLFLIPSDSDFTTIACNKFTSWGKGIIGKLDINDIAGAVQKILTCHERLTSLQKGLKASQETAIALDNAFKTMLITVSDMLGDHDYNIIPTILARYCNLLLRKNSRMVNTDEEGEQLLEKVLPITSFIPNRDVFLHHMIKLFTDRLVLNNTKDTLDDVVIHKLKGIDSNAATPLLRIKTEYQNSLSLSNSFAELPENPFGSQFSCLVFGIINSTLRDSFEAEIPEHIKNVFNNFQQFYTKKKHNQKLTPCWSKSSGILALNKTFSITSSLYQMVLLLKFNEESEYTVSRLAELTKIPITSVKRFLSGAVVKKVLLIKDSKLFDSTVVQVNPKFISKTKRFTVMPIAKDLIDEKEPMTVIDDTDHKEVISQRENILKCTLVRIMKNEKVLPCQELIQRAVQMVSKRFKADITFVRRVIESLIENDYLRRNLLDIEYVA
ncbi:Cullin family profile domain-containing protein [Entamoeba marina]